MLTAAGRRAAMVRPTDQTELLQAIHSSSSHHRILDPVLCHSFRDDNLCLGAANPDRATSFASSCIAAAVASQVPARWQTKCRSTRKWQTDRD